MFGDHDPRGRAPHPDRPRSGPDAGDPRLDARHPSALRRFLGGPPAAVLVKLLFLSMLVGSLLAMLDLSPGQLFRWAYDGVRALADLGLDTFRDLGRWLLAGALVVVPLWLIARLLAVSR